MAARKLLTIAIAGNPNCGKTALFNALTGARQHVGNWPGVTVEKKEGYFELGDRQIRLVDLPGTYALFANAEDERAAVDYLLSREASLIINIVDATNLERNLFLTSQLADMKIPMVIAVNMMDIAENRGIQLDLDELSDFYGVPCIPLSAVSEKSVTNFISQMGHVLASPMPLPKQIRGCEGLGTEGGSGRKTLGDGCPLGFAHVPGQRKELRGQVCRSGRKNQQGRCREDSGRRAGIRDGRKPLFHLA